MQRSGEHQLGECELALAPAASLSAASVCGAIGAAGRRAGRPLSARSVNGCGKPAGGRPSAPRRKSSTESGRSKLAGLALELVEVDAGGDREDREVADDLAGRRDLDDVAEQRVGALVGGLDLLEAVADADRGRPGGAGSTAGRRGSRGGRRGRSARADPDSYGA